MGPSSQQSTLMDEFRVRLQVDKSTSCVITGNEATKIEQTIRQIFPQSNVSRESNVTWLTYSDRDGNRHRTVVSEYQITAEQSVTHFNGLRKQAQKAA